MQNQLNRQVVPNDIQSERKLHPNLNSKVASKFDDEFSRLSYTVDREALNARGKTFHNTFDKILDSNSVERDINRQNNWSSAKEKISYNKLNVNLLDRSELNRAS